MFKREFSNSVQLLYVYATAQVNSRNYLAVSQTRSRCSASNFDPIEEGAFSLMRFVRHRRKKSRYNHKHIWQEQLIVQENPAARQDTPHVSDQ